MCLHVRYCDKKLQLINKMATVRIDDKLPKEIQDWLDKNGKKYKHPLVSAFLNNTIYDKLKQLNNKK